MKNLIAILIMSLSSVVFAGGMSSIPIELLNVDNQGRAEFIKNALKQTQLDGAKGVKYEIQSIIIGGDEDGSDYLGGLFGYRASLHNRNGDRFSCEQIMSVGNFDPAYTQPINCKSL